MCNMLIKKQEGCSLVSMFLGSMQFNRCVLKVVMPTTALLGIEITQRDSGEETGAS